MELKNIHNIYFLGIGGIGMSALARYFKDKGKNVAGYDKTTTTLTKTLEQEGIEIHYQDAVSNIPKAFKTPVDTLVIYTPAIAENHTEWQYFINHKYTIHKRARVLGWITEKSFCFAVAGTHGKTTTATILAHILKNAKIPFTAFLGGISENYNSNFITEGMAYTVVEADEFDRSFLQLSPNIACITAIDADHLDSYGSKEEVENTFSTFIAAIKPQGKLVVRKGVPFDGITYGIEDGSDYTISNVRIRASTYLFDVVTPEQKITDLVFPIPGRHNLLNALAAIAMAEQIGVSSRCFIKALATFRGIKRRFSYQIKTEQRIYIDDYAHHPTEINAVYNAIKEMHPNASVLVIFQPHLYSRTRDFVDEFADSLSRFDEIIMLDIYPAREAPISGIDATWLLSKINNPNKKLVSKEKLIDEVKKTQAKLIVTIGAGDIGKEVKKIKKALLS